MPLLGRHKNLLCHLQFGQYSHLYFLIYRVKSKGGRIFLHQTVIEVFLVVFQKTEIGQNICQIIFVPSTNIAQILMGNLLRPIKRCKRIFPKSRKNEKSTRPQSKTKFKKNIPKMASRRNLKHILRPNSQMHFHTLTISTTSTEKPKNLSFF